MTDLPQPGSEAERDPVDAARDEIARRMEAQYPGWKISHGLLGWTAEQPGREAIRIGSHDALRALLDAHARPPPHAGESVEQVVARLKAEGRLC